MRSSRLAAPACATPAVSATAWKDQAVEGSPSRRKRRRKGAAPLCNPLRKWSSLAARRAPALRVAGRAKDVRFAHARPAPLVGAGFVVRSVDLAARPSPTRRAAGRPAQRARRPACRAPGLVAGCLVAAAGWQKRPVLATAPQRRRERRPPPRRKLSPQKRRLIGAPADSCPPPTIQSCSQTIPVKVSK